MIVIRDRESIKLASFPGLPHFYLQFALIIHGNGRPAKFKTRKHWEDLSCEWTRGGCRGEGLTFKYVFTNLNLKVSFLPLKASSFDHTKVWSPKLQLSA